jgi:hypothetical protein
MLYNTFNFHDLKHNLYDILKLNINSDEKTIKKVITQLIKETHPDKNNYENDEEKEIMLDIYTHLMKAKDILLNKVTRSYYDEYLLTYHNINSHLDLKNSFNNDKNKQNETNEHVKIKDIEIEFNNLLEKKNKKHGINDFIENKDIKEEFNNLLESRNKEILIENKDINDNNFNDSFKNKKKKDIIKYNNNDSIQLYDSNYSNLSDFTELYINDNSYGKYYSNINSGFELHNVNDDIDIKNDNVLENFNKLKNEYENLLNKK